MDTPLLGDAPLAALTTTLLPPWPALPDALRGEVEADVVDYVRRQIRRMPLFLRAPWTAVLLVFAAGAMLRYGRPFASLSSARRRAWVRLWAESPVVPMRDFVRMVRSCALLAWFDHPVVSDALSALAKGSHV